MTQNLVKNIICNVASSVQVNIAIEIPNITKNYKNSHVFTCQHWVSAMLIQIYATLLGCFLILFGGLGANWNVSGKTWYEISYFDKHFVISSPDNQHFIEE